MSSWSNNSTTLNLGNVSALDTIVVENVIPIGMACCLPSPLEILPPTELPIRRWQNIRTWTETVTTVQLPEGTVQRSLKLLFRKISMHTSLSL